MAELKIKNSIAVIIRTKDREILLQRALESVVDQTFDNFKVIIVNDGGSKQNVEKLVKEFGDKRISVLNNQKSVGRWPAANQGIRSCKSDYIVLLDDDDSWHPNFLQKTVDYLQETKCQGVASSSNRITEEVKDDKIKKINETVYYAYEGLPILAYTMFQENLVPTNCFVFTREAYEKLNGYNEAMQVSADWDFNRRFVELYDIETIPEMLAYIHHRVNTNDEAMNNTVLTGRKTHYRTQIIRLNEIFRSDIQNGLAKGLLENELRYQLKNQQKNERDLEQIKKQLEMILSHQKQTEQPNIAWSVYQKVKKHVPKSIKERLRR